ncbi:putative mitochondrial-processing peptidase subunit alpha protein [Rosellinia necatrix]|uniref:Putative mitochondrial-processing peptidase subunit alpha protein n=1 Tax=Rosellinia necatrix TaxID=77044 RepID=A0A1W2TNB0_ROSNE|nr:putative mitochondrial-processing peptidase subunit alpha protein [Rosellinia necatrix]
MKREGDDVEAAAQLVMSKEDGRARSHESFDFDYEYEEPNDAYSYLSTRYRSYQSSSRQLWRRIQSIPLPNWFPVRKLNQLSPRYLIFIFVASLTITALIVNPYGPPIPTAISSSVAESSTGSEDPAPSEFCTTWPVDEDGGYYLDAPSRTNRFKSDSIAPQGGWQKPEGFKIIAMVFFGRKRYVDILDCYLQQNLASNGGYLDEVWFMAHTEDEEDLAWLDRLVSKNRDYKTVGHEDCGKNDHKYGCLWTYATADNTLYIKLDDDIIYIHPDAIPQLVHTRLAVPHAFGVSAHLVNSPITGMEQFHHNAIYPFVPDPNDGPTHKASETWRLSGLDRYPKSGLAKLKEESDHSIMFPDVPYRGHPFVLLSEDNFDLLHTSMGRYDQDPGGDFIAFSPVWKSWAMAAQQQYSLLYNLEKNQISRYFFGRPATYPAHAKGPDRNSTVSAPRRQGEPTLGGEQIFDTQFRRYNLNFCAVWGSDIKKHLPMNDDDEDAITHLIPQKTGRPFIIDTRAVVGHFSFFTQAEEMRQTDLLDRWRAFANEAVCRPHNLKKPWDLRCPKFTD